MILNQSNSDSDYILWKYKDARRNPDTRDRLKSRRKMENGKV